MRVGDAGQPTFTRTYPHISCSVRSSREGRYTHPISSLPLCTLWFAHPLSQYLPHSNRVFSYLYSNISPQSRECTDKEERFYIEENPGSIPPYILIDEQHELATCFRFAPTTRETFNKGRYHGVTKRCRLSWLTNSALIYGPKRGGGGDFAGSQPMSTSVHMEPK